MPELHEDCTSEDCGCLDRSHEKSNRFDEKNRLFLLRYGTSGTLSKVSDSQKCGLLSEEDARHLLEAFGRSSEILGHLLDGSRSREPASSDNFEV